MKIFLGRICRKLLFVPMLYASGMVAMIIPSSLADPPEMSVRDQMDILRTSRDREAIEKAAMAVIDSKNEEATALLRDLLARAEFLERLDHRDEYLVAYRMRLVRILRAVAKSCPESWRFLLSLAEMPTYAPSTRDRWLAPILASRFCSNPGEPMIAWLRAIFWKKGVGSGSARDALAWMDSKRSGEVLAEAIVDSTFSIMSREEWLLINFIELRYTDRILPVYRAAVEKGKSGNLAATAVEGLLEYRKEWYMPHKVPGKPPDYGELPLAKLRELSEILRIAESRGLKPDRPELPRANDYMNRDVPAVIRLHKPRIEALIREREREEQEKEKKK